MSLWVRILCSLGAVITTLLGAYYAEKIYIGIIGALIVGLIAFITNAPTLGKRIVYVSNDNETKADDSEEGRKQQIKSTALIIIGTAASLFLISYAIDLLELNLKGGFWLSTLFLPVLFILAWTEGTTRVDSNYLGKEKYFRVVMGPTTALFIFLIYNIILLISDTVHRGVAEVKSVEVTNFIFINSVYITCIFCFILGMLWISRIRSMLIGILLFPVTIFLIALLSQFFAIVTADEKTSKIMLDTLISGLWDLSLIILMFTAFLTLGAITQRLANWIIGRMA